MYFLLPKVIPFYPRSYSLHKLSTNTKLFRSKVQNWNFRSAWKFNEIKVNFFPSPQKHFICHFWWLSPSDSEVFEFAYILLCTYIAARFFLLSHPSIFSSCVILYVTHFMFFIEACHFAIRHDRRRRRMMQKIKFFSDNVLLSQQKKWDGKRKRKTKEFQVRSICKLNHSKSSGSFCFDF